MNLGDSLILDTDITVGGGEVKTGATWNGKPVYAKSVKCQFPAAAGDRDKLHDISNLDQLVNVIAYTQSGWRTPVCYGTPTNYSLIYVNNTTIKIQTNNSTNANQYVDVCLFYTKTTD